MAIKTFLLLKMHFVISNESMVVRTRSLSSCWSCCICTWHFRLLLFHRVTGRAIFSQGFCQIFQLQLKLNCELSSLYPKSTSKLPNKESSVSNQFYQFTFPQTTFSHKVYFFGWYLSKVFSVNSIAVFEWHF